MGSVAMMASLTGSDVWAVAAGVVASAAGTIGAVAGFAASCSTLNSNFFTSAKARSSSGCGICGKGCVGRGDGESSNLVVDLSETSFVTCEQTLTTGGTKDTAGTTIVVALGTVLSDTDGV